jgi:hypothetical protein
MLEFSRCALLRTEWSVPCCVDLGTGAVMLCGVVHLNAVSHWLPPPEQATTCPRLTATARRARVQAALPAEAPRSDVTATSTTSLVDIAAATPPSLQQDLTEAWATRPRHPRARRSHSSSSSSWTCPWWRLNQGHRPTNSNPSLALQGTTPPR